MCDITKKLNELNCGLQGENKIISQMANKVFAFEEKLDIYYKDKYIKKYRTKFYIISKPLQKLNKMTL